MILLSMICGILFLFVVGLLLAVTGYQHTIDEMERKIRQYDTWLRTTDTWLVEEMRKREMLEKGPDMGIIEISGKKIEGKTFNPCKN